MSPLQPKCLVAPTSVHPAPGVVSSCLSVLRLCWVTPSCCLGRSSSFQEQGFPPYLQAAQRHDLNLNISHCRLLPPWHPTGSPNKEQLFSVRCNSFLLMKAQGNLHGRYLVDFLTSPHWVAMVSQPCSHTGAVPRWETQAALTEERPLS